MNAEMNITDERNITVNEKYYDFINETISQVLNCEVDLTSESREKLNLIKVKQLPPGATEKKIQQRWKSG